MKIIQTTGRLWSLLLALVLLVSTTGFVVDMHFCKGQLKNFSLVGKAKSCHESKKATAALSCPHHKKAKTEQATCEAADSNNCCDASTAFLQADIDQQITPSLTFAQVSFLVSILPPLVDLFFATTKVEQKITPFPTHLLYPLQARDTYALLQTWRF